MKRPDDPMREIAALRERLSRLSEASLHITEDLDLNAVLQGVLDGARSLTGARMGGVTILDDSGQLQDFITSGLTDEDHQRFVNLPGGPEFFAYLSSLPEPLRLADFSAHTTALGLPEVGPPLGPVGSFLGAPSVSGAYAPATSIYRTRRAEGSSPRMTRRPWRCSRPMRQWPSPMRGGTGRSRGPGPTLRR